MPNTEPAWRLKSLIHQFLVGFQTKELEAILEDNSINWDRWIFTTLEEEIQRRVHINA